MSFYHFFSVHSIPPTPPHPHPKASLSVSFLFISVLLFLSASASDVHGEISTSLNHHQNEKGVPGLMQCRYVVFCVGI